MELRGQCSNFLRPDLASSLRRLLARPQSAHSFAARDRYECSSTCSASLVLSGRLRASHQTGHEAASAGRLPSVPISMADEAKVVPERKGLPRRLRTACAARLISTAASRVTLSLRLWQVDQLRMDCSDWNVGREHISWGYQDRGRTPVETTNCVCGAAQSNDWWQMCSSEGSHQKSP